MGILAIDRRVHIELLDTRGNLAIQGARPGSPLVRGCLSDVADTLTRGQDIEIMVVVGSAQFVVVGRLLTDAIPVAAGARARLEVLRAGPAGISRIEPFDMVPDDAFNDDPPTLTNMPTDMPPPIALSDADDDEPTGVFGSLKEMPLSDIVQSLQQNRKDAVVEMNCKDRESGSVGFVGGRMVFARTATRVGDAAFFEMVAATRGAFRVRYNRAPDSTNIIRDTSFMVLEGMRLLDEAERAGSNPIVVDIAVAVPVAAPTAGLTPSGRFACFFEEAGVLAPPPMNDLKEDLAMRFASLSALKDDGFDVDAPDNDITSRERLRRVPSESHSDLPN